MRFSIGLLFSLLASVAQSAVTFSVERAVSAPVYAPAVGEEHGFAAASDGTDFLVLWGGAPLYATRAIRFHVLDQLGLLGDLD
jgi:hypothetical protein